MKFRMLLATIVVALFASFAQAENCNSVVIDKAGIVQNPSLIANAASTLINQGADVKVITVPSVAQYAQFGSGLAGVEAYFEQTCPNFSTNGVRKANLFVVMVAPNDRQKNIFLGSYYGGSFDIPSAYGQSSNGFFKARQWDNGLAAVLRNTTSPALSFRQRAIVAQRQRPQVVVPQQRVYTQQPTYVPPPQTADSGMSGVAIFFLVLLFVGVVVTILYFVFRETPTSTSSTTYVDNTDYGSSSSTYRPRSYGAAAPSHTTIINNDSGSGNGLLTGVLIGEAMSRPSYVQPSTVYVEPATVYTDPSPAFTAPVVDAPDTTWQDNTPTQQDVPDQSFEAAPSYEAPETPSFDAPSTDFGSSGGDTGF